MIDTKSGEFASKLFMNRRGQKKGAKKLFEFRTFMRIFNRLGEFKTLRFKVGATKQCGFGVKAFEIIDKRDVLGFDFECYGVPNKVSKGQKRDTYKVHHPFLEAEFIVGCAVFGDALLLIYKKGLGFKSVKVSKL